MGAAVEGAPLPCLEGAGLQHGIDKDDRSSSLPFGCGFLILVPAIPTAGLDGYVIQKTTW